MGFQMTDTIKHTPAPWKSFDKTLPDASTDFPCTVITASNGCPLAYVGNHAGYKANAAFIIKAVNCHDELLAALKGLTDKYKGDAKLFAFEKDLLAARAAIAKAGVAND